jgi:hypothetical protein
VRAVLRGFNRHVEKIVLLTAVMLVALFFCLGYSTEGLPANKTPSELKKKITQVMSHLSRDSWNVIAPGRTPDMRHPERVDEGRMANEDRAYPLATLDLPPIRPNGYTEPSSSLLSSSSASTLDRIRPRRNQTDKIAAKM